MGSNLVFLRSGPQALRCGEVVASYKRCGGPDCRRQQVGVKFLRRCPMHLSVIDHHPSSPTAQGRAYLLATCYLRSGPQVARLAVRLRSGCGPDRKACGPDRNEIRTHPVSSSLPAASTTHSKSRSQVTSPYKSRESSRQSHPSDNQLTPAERCLSHARSLSSPLSSSR